MSKSAEKSKSPSRKTSFPDMIASVSIGEVLPFQRLKTTYAKFARYGFAHIFFRRSARTISSLPAMRASVFSILLRISITHSKLHDDGSLYRRRLQRKSRLIGPY